MFLEADFRMRMKIAADGDEFVDVTLDQFDIGHGLLSRFLNV